MNRAVAMASSGSVGTPVVAIFPCSCQLSSVQSLELPEATDFDYGQAVAVKPGQDDASDAKISPLPRSESPRRASPQGDAGGLFPRSIPSPLDQLDCVPSQIARPAFPPTLRRVNMEGRIVVVMPGATPQETLACTLHGRSHQRRCGPRQVDLVLDLIPGARSIGESHRDIPLSELSEFRSSL
jgi:hypothetical protein